MQHVVSEDSVSSFDVLEAAMISEQKAMGVPTSSDEDNQTSSSFEEEAGFSAEAYADAEQMLKEMLNNN